MNRKTSGIHLIVLGAALAVAINALDFIRGKEFTFGRAQAGVTLLGVLLIIVGILICFTRIPLPKIPRINWRKLVDKLETFLSTLNTQLRAWSSGKTFDIIVISGFALYAVTYTLGRWNGVSPFIYLGSDASYISSYAASLDHPEKFASDYFLSNSAHVSSYFEVLVPVVRFLGNITGNYATAFLIILPITIFLKLLGFYLVGKSLFKNKLLGLLLTLITFPIVYSGAWDYWGILGDALPRNLFEVCFPWLILCAVKWIGSPIRWLLLAFILGALTYVHAISAGVTFFALSFTYLLLSPSPFWKRAGHLLLSAIIYLVSITPFIYFFSSSLKAAMTVPISYADKLQILYKIYGENHFQTLTIFGKVLVQLAHSGILPLALLAVLLFLKLRKNQDWQSLKVIGVWVTGIVLISVLFPWLESFVDPWLKIVTVQMMMIRGLRYVPPLLLVFSMLVFFGRGEKAIGKYPHLQNGVAVSLFLATLVLIVAKNPHIPYFNLEIRCLSTGHWVCPAAEDLHAVDIIQALDQYTNEGDSILSIPPLNVKFNTAIRYQALRPLGYVNTDVTRMSSDPGLQMQVCTAMKPWDALEHAAETTRLASYLAIAADMQADYLIVQLDDFPKASARQLDVIYTNAHYALVKVQQEESKQ